MDVQSLPPYEIPFRCLAPMNIEGLLVAGRCISADHAGKVQDALRKLKMPLHAEEVK